MTWKCNNLGLSTIHSLFPLNTFTLLNAQAPLLPHDTWQNLKLGGVVITAALLAVFLLWLLFSGEPSEKACTAHPFQSHVVLEGAAL